MSVFYSLCIYTRAESSPGNLSHFYCRSQIHCSISCRAYLAKVWGGSKGKIRNRQEIVLYPPLFSPVDSPFINHSALIEKLRCCSLFVTQAGKLLTKKIKCRICNICCLNRGGVLSVSSF